MKTNVGKVFCFGISLLVFGCDNGLDQLRVMFDGEGCSVTGPSAIRSGETLFILEDRTDFGASLYVSGLHDGHTYQEMVELSEAAGGPGSYYPKPAWVENQRRIHLPPSEEIVLADNETFASFFLKAGPNSVYVYADGGLWFCGPLEVMEAASE